MDHAEAIQTQAAEKYLLGEFSATQQEEFAEHFFECEECAEDVRLTALFMDTAKRVMARDLADKPPASVERSPYRWQAARYAIAASVALLAFILYQNVVTIPRLRSFAAPQALAYFPMTNLGSRSSAQTVLTPIHQKPFILLLDVPPHENIYEYRCEIFASNGNKLVSIDVSEVLAKKTVPLLIPASALSPGSYTLTISGRSEQEASYTQFEKYPFQVM